MFGFTEQEKYFRQPVISIGMPAYNSEKYIRIAIESILAQEFEDYELIIYDNGSKDGTQEICTYYQQFDPRIKFFQSSARLSFSRLFTRLTEAAVGEYFLLISPEHRCEKTYLSACLKKMQENPGAVFCYSEKIYIDKNNRPVGKKVNMPEPVEFETSGLTTSEKFKMLFRYSYWNINYGLFKTDILKKEAYFPDIFGSYIVFLAKLLLAGDFVKVPQPLFYYRYIENEITAYSIEKLLRAYNSNSNEKIFTMIAREIIKNISSSDLPAKEKIELKEFLLDELSEKTSGWQKKLFSENNVSGKEELKKILFEKNDKKVFPVNDEPLFNENLFSEKEKIQLAEIKKFQENEEYSEALTLTEELLKTYPVNDYLLNLQAELHFCLEDYEKAISLYLKLFELYPFNSRYFGNAAVCLWQKRRIPEALRLFNRAIRLEPTDYNAILNYSQALESLGYYDEINNLYLTCIKNEPDNNGRYIYLAESIIKNKLQEKYEQKHYPFLVSVILIHTEPSDHLFEKLEELEKQTIREKMEIIVIDTTGEFERKKNEIENNFSEVQYIPVTGFVNDYGLWNIGIKNSSGKYLTIVKNNSMYWKDIFEDMADELENNNFLGFVYTDIIITYDSDQNAENYGESDLVIFHDWDRNTFLKEGYPIGLQTMWRRRIHDEYGYFDEIAGDIADYEFWLRISQTNEIRHLKYFVGFYIDFSYNIEEKEFRKFFDFNNSLIKKEYLSAYEKHQVIKRSEQTINLCFENEIKKSLLSLQAYKKTNLYLDTDIFRDFRMLPEQSFYILLRNNENINELPVTYYNNITDQIWVKSKEERALLLKKGIIESKVKVFEITGKHWKDIFAEVNAELLNLPKAPVRLQLKRYSKDFYYNFAFSLYLQRKYKEAIIYFIKGMDIDDEDVPEDILNILSECYKNTGDKNKGVFFPKGES